jgi:FlaA1/EpsC-like NDP-sugar epimerase
MRITIYYIYFNIIFKKSNTKNLIVYGAGEGGIQVSQSVSTIDQYKLVAFIDDDVSKQNKIINGIRIYSDQEIEKISKIHKIHTILLAIPSLTLDRRRLILNKLKKTNIRVQIMPSVSEFVSSGILFDNFRDINLNDILDRKLNVDYSGIYEKINGKTVLVTGAGGSIGSEIASQLVNFNPKRIIIMDNTEFNLYQIEKKLIKIIKDLKIECNIVSSLTSINNKKALKKYFENFRPNLVFHAAAYKHLSIVENNIIDSFQNNFIGSINILNLCIEFKIEKIIYVSTDKAVKPSSIMGATKRLTEIVYNAYNYQDVSKLDISIVRFGNVLGSSGSIIPLFSEQINNGGPVTVTHPDASRYFMTIPEAVSLVLQSTKFSEENKGTIFILNMGKSIKIIDLAKKLITLHGLKIYDNQKTFNPTKHIKVEYIGLKKAEKLHEELSTVKSYTETTNENIFIDLEEPLDILIVKNIIEESDNAVKNNDLHKIMFILKKHADLVREQNTKSL